MSKKDRPLKWTVVCPNFVSVHDVYADALKHANAIAQVGTCKEKHAVAQTVPGVRQPPREGVEEMKIGIAVIAVLVVLIGFAAHASYKAQKAWEAGCISQGGHVDSISKTSTGIGTGYKGKPVTTTSTSTTYYCLTDDGRILEMR